MKILALLAIRIYQRMISPYKGFRCAYAACTGHASCSALGYRAIRRYGVADGMGVLNARLQKCGVAYRRYCTPAPRALGNQAGFVDCACDGGCDSPSCHLPGCDVCGCDWGGTTDGDGPGSRGSRRSDCTTCDLVSCDWNGKRKRSRDEEQYVVIPPNTTLR